MAHLGYKQVKPIYTQLTHADGPVGIHTIEVIIYSTQACRWPSCDIHKWSHYLLNSRMQMAQLGYTQVKSIYNQLTHADGPDGIYTSEANVSSTHACRWHSWDTHKWSHYLLNSCMQMAQLRYTQVKSLSPQLKHADGPVGIYTSEVNIYSTQACRWPSWDNGICTSEVIIYSTHAWRWPSWDMHRRSPYLLKSRRQMAQLGYTQVKSLSPQLTHADSPVGIYTSEVNI